jgi:hypothetical protein
MLLAEEALMAIDAKTSTSRRPAGSAKSLSGPRAHTTAGRAKQTVAPHWAQGSEETAAESAAGNDSCGRTVNLSFYDAATLAKLLPAPQTQLELRSTDGKSSWPVTLTENRATKLLSFPIPADLFAKLPAQTENDFESAETLCDIPTSTDADLVVLTSPKPLAISCQSYTMSNIALVLSSAANEQTSSTSRKQDLSTADEDASTGNEASTNATAPPCSISVPLTRLEESYTVKFFAFDTCFKDYLLNAKALINEVEVTATPVNTQSSGAATRPRAARITGRTVDGFVELPGLTPHQLYRVEVKGPSDYVCVKPPQPYLYQLRGRSVPIHAFFQPCGKFPARSVIFVQQDCLGLRVPSLDFHAGGNPASSDENGIWNVPVGMTGSIDFQAQGKVFLPASIDLNDEAPMAIVVAVADQTVGQLSHHGGRRFFFLDEKGEPFKHRKLQLRSHTGDESTVYTDSEGGFEAYEGWLASADEDASGLGFTAHPLWTAKV